MKSKRTEILSELYNLESKYRLAYNKKDFSDAQEFLQKKIDIIKAHPRYLVEPEDFIRVEQYRKMMTAYRKVREALGGLSQVDFLKKAADYSTPTVCVEKTCPLDPQKCPQRAILSNRQKKMCIEKISAVSTALKIEAAFAAQSFNYSQALEKRQEAARIHQVVLKVGFEFDPDNQRQRLGNQRYLDYWYLVTEGYVSLIKGEFDKSKEWFEKAHKIGKLLPFEDCFPNYFYSLEEIRTHKFYIDAIKNVKSGQFAKARDSFRDWLMIGSKGTRFRFDNIKIFEMICNVLELYLKEEVKKEDWDELDRFVGRAYVGRTTWALLLRLDWIREFSSRLKQEDPPALKFNLRQEVEKIAQQWQLFISDAILLGEDRTAGFKKREVNFLSFIDIFDKLDEDKHNWQELLLQNLKNLFLIMADYEHLRYLYPPPEEADLSRGKHPPIATEIMTIDELTRIILFYLEHRSRRHARIFRRALQSLDSFELAIKKGDFNESMDKQKSLFETIRFWPHVIHVVKQEEIQRVFFDEYEPNFLVWKTVCSRMWNRKPGIIIFEGPQKLEEKSYYYLRPVWNIRMCDRLSPRIIRHEQFLQSDIPQRMNVFFENTFGKGRSVDPERFHNWILQFDRSERLLACKLFSMVKFYREDEVREMWLRLYREKLPPEAKIEKVAYVGLGHMAKSGPYHCHYHLRQAMSSKLNQNEYSFDFKKAFREISEYDRECEKPHTVIFIDDFIGKGTQAIDWFINREEAYFKKYPWLNEVNVYYCALVGFKKGIETIRGALRDKIRDVLVLEELDEKDRAFSERNPNWKSEERIEAERWASEIGRQVLESMPKYDDPEKGIYPKDHKLGWGNSQALIVFHYNIPNNTLPIFWGEGERNEKKWKPLWIRYD